MTPEPEYNEAQVQQILQTALAKRPNHDQKLSRSQVQEIAADLGVSESDFQNAEREWMEAQVIDLEKIVFDRYQKRKFKDGAIKYVLVNSTLVVLNLLTSQQISWSAYLLVVWGLGVALQAWTTFQTDSDSYAKQFNKWQQTQKRNRLTSKITDKAISKLSDWISDRK